MAPRCSDTRLQTAACAKRGLDTGTESLVNDQADRGRLDLKFERSVEILHLVAGGRTSGNLNVGDLQSFGASREDLALISINRSRQFID
jgi:hypothetical protein